MSIRIHIVTEGQTETNFVNKLLVPHFSAQNIALIPCTVVTNADKKAGRLYKGGISSYAKVKNNIEICLRYTKTASVYVTTMFDFYGLPEDFPGYDGIKNIADPYHKVAFLENALQEDICKDNAAFLPYLSLHEFEALLFSDIAIIEDHFFDHDISALKTLRDFNPELINNEKQTSPSKRILKCIPVYHKSTDGIAIALKIGLEPLRAKCKHFSRWIEKLETLEK